MADIFGNYFNTVEQQYDIIKRREKIIKTINRIAFFVFVASVAILLFYPSYSLGGEQHNIFNFFFSNMSEGGVEKEVKEFLQPLFKDVWLFDLLMLASTWYIFLKVLTFVLSIIKGFFKLIFGGFFRRGKNLTHDEKIKVVEKYKKKNSHGLIKKIISFVISNIISFVFPMLSDMLQLKKDLTSTFLPLIYMLMTITCIYIPLGRVTGAVVSGMELTINMLPLTLAMIFAIAHSVTLFVAYIVKTVFKWRKIK